MREYLRRLKGDVDRWVEAGMIDAALGRRLLADAAAQEDGAPGGLGTITLLGLTAVALGVLTVIASNWPGIDGLWRLALLFTVSAGSCLGAAELRVRGRMAGANFLAALAAVLAGGGLVVIGQLYHSGATTAAFLGLWSMTAAAVAILLWSPLGAAVAAMTTTAWTVFALAEADWSLGAGAASPPGALAVLLGLGVMAHLKRSLFTAHLVILASFVWASPFIGDLVIALNAGWEDSPLSASLTAVAVWAALAAAFEILARSTGAFAARTAAGWAAFIATFGLVSASAIDKARDADTALLVPLGALVIFTALAAYGAAPGRRWLRGAGATGFVLTALTLFGWTDNLALAGLGLILVGLSLIALLWGTDRLAARFGLKGQRR